MAFVKKQWQGKKKGNGVGGGAFKSKSGEFYVAKFSGDWFKKLVAVVKDATKEIQPGIVMFISKNDRKSDKDPHLKVSISVDKPFKKNKIRDDEDDLGGLDGDSDGDDLGNEEKEDTDFN